ncbi:SDR family NAD(P)-dependent oxidoreductase [Lutispora thermophila]|uniref:Short-chain dehydrogenase n=1 Tax=Lutispora thermophila DSM 19022 TaxID=1122184 RepID=A0A1M6IVR7_9FIRM|nr:SDR family NAD(P)-dependent oxidoreductase [Lutispora thermophila]SHJ38474.1 Short-chain dehydrogenase [Lutispora thermophila DSM 19022]
MKDFKDKVIVVTGAGSGIGEAIAKEAVLHGMKVVINDIDANGLEKTLEDIRAMGGEVVSQCADISQLKNVQALYDLTMRTYGQVDILVNNAGVAVSGPIWEIPVQDINWITEVNLLSHAYGMRIFIPKMIEQGTEAAVINVASTAGIMVSPNAVMYHSTKAADVALAESTYLGLKARGINNIQIHALCPAFIQTKIYESDKYRPERYASMDDPYYQSQEFKAGFIRSKRSVLGGIPIDSVGMTVFTALEDNKFYIFTHPESIYPASQRLMNMVNGKNPA